MGKLGFTMKINIRTTFLVLSIFGAFYQIGSYVHGQEDQELKNAVPNLEKSVFIFLEHLQNTNYAAAFDLIYHDNDNETRDNIPTNLDKFKKSQLVQALRSNLIKSEYIHELGEFKITGDIEYIDSKDLNVEKAIISFTVKQFDSKKYIDYHSCDKDCRIIKQVVKEETDKLALCRSSSCPTHQLFAEEDKEDSGYRQVDPFNLNVKTKDGIEKSSLVNHKLKLEIRSPKSDIGWNQWYPYSLELDSKNCCDNLLKNTVIYLGEEIFSTDAKRLIYLKYDNSSENHLVFNDALLPYFNNALNSESKEEQNRFLICQPNENVVVFLYKFAKHNLNNNITLNFNHSENSTKLLLPKGTVAYLWGNDDAGVQSYNEKRQKDSAIWNTSVYGDTFWLQIIVPINKKNFSKKCEIKNPISSSFQQPEVIIQKSDITTLKICHWYSTEWVQAIPFLRTSILNPENNVNVCRISEVLSLFLEIQIDDYFQDIFNLINASCMRNLYSASQTEIGSKNSISSLMTDIQDSTVLLVDISSQPDSQGICSGSLLMDHTNDFKFSSIDGQDTLDSMYIISAQHCNEQLGDYKSKIAKNQIIAVWDFRTPLCARKQYGLEVNQIPEFLTTIASGMSITPAVFDQFSDKEVEIKSDPNQPIQSLLSENQIEILSDDSGGFTPPNFQDFLQNPAILENLTSSNLFRKTLFDQIVTSNSNPENIQINNLDFVTQHAVVTIPTSIVQGFFELAETDTVIFELQPPTYSGTFFALGWQEKNYDSLGYRVSHPEKFPQSFSMHLGLPKISQYITNDYLIRNKQEVIDFDYSISVFGSTKPGSSGSALISQERKIIGQLKGKWVLCDLLTKSTGDEDDKDKDNFCPKNENGIAIYIDGSLEKFIQHINSLSLFARERRGVCSNINSGSEPILNNKSIISPYEVFGLINNCDSPNIR